MKVALSTAALRDLRQIGDYIAKDNATRSARFTRELRARIRGLGEWPERFPIMPRFAREGFRRCVYGRYAIVYQVGRDRVFVVRVFHTAQDYEALLNPEA